MEAHENCILTGIADSFCLSCQMKVQDLEVHIESSAHKKALKSTAYEGKYEDEFIRKVKIGYYCEVCNIMIQTLAKVGVHVRDAAHLDNKTKHYIKPSNEGVVAFDRVLISKQAWHGLIDGSCVICTTDYEDEIEHLNDAKHLVNLIQSKFELKKDKIIYRQIDENMVCCMICNSIITTDSKESHINKQEHLSNYSECAQNKNRLFSQVDIPIDDNVMKKENEPKDKDKLTTKEISSVMKKENEPKDKETLTTKEISSVMKKENEPKVKERSTTKEISTAMKKENEPKDKESLTAKEISTVMKKENEPKVKERSTTKEITTVMKKENEPKDKERLGTTIEISSVIKKENELKDKERLTTKEEISSLDKDGIITSKKNVADSLDNKAAGKSINKNKGNFCKKEKTKMVSSVIEDTEISDNKDKSNSDNKCEENSGSDVDNKLDEGKQEKLLKNKETCIVKYDERSKEDDTENKDKILTHKKIKALVKDNHMKYIKRSIYCKLCNVRFSSSDNLIKEHVEEASHKDKMNNEKEKIKTKHITKTAMVQFIYSEETAECLLVDFIIINNIHCITMQSYHMITKNLRCQACEVSLIPDNVKSHKQSFEHALAMQVTPVLTNYREEFIREVRPKIYHCGDCNLVEAGIDGLTKHLCSQNHKETMETHRSMLFRQVQRSIEAKRRLQLCLLLHTIGGLGDFF